MLDPSNWPFLSECLEKEILEPVDVLLAAHLLNSNNAALEPAAAALCHLSVALRSGHLCMEISPIAPSPSLFWESCSSRAAPLIAQGITDLLEHLPRGLVLERGAFYFERFRNAQSLCAQLVQKHEAFRPSETIDEETFKRNLALYPHLLPRQIDAILTALHHTITLITGGPGTGKTHTAGCFIDVLWKSLTPSQKANFKIALAAPTGKAAAHLMQSLIDKLGDERDAITSSTLHTLLGISPSSHEPKLKLTHDLVLVDESSMIDIHLMVCLLKSLKPGSRLILLGDHRQLPPVEPGSPFFDLVRYRSDAADTTLRPAFLTDCMRADLKEIIHFADAVNRGDHQEVIHTLCLQQQPIIGRILPEAHGFRKTISALADDFPPLCCEGEHPDPLALKAFRVLSPLKKGLWGVESLNSALHKELMGRLPQGSTAAIPIILVANDHQLKLYNGEVGFLLRDAAYFYASDKSWRKVPLTLLPRYQYGYCLSVHKSQGSEFDKVSVLLPQGSETLGRAVLYTAVTRARRALEIIYDPATIESTILNEQGRLSHLAACCKSLDG